ncbi:hypothetical protein BGZ63DRAFT_349687 [Mariannaea sp. PMI_226]|nr:hypothetical protein BGZ63DRAFT_349687 [Mariannaea sp. PMI_226]
MSAAGWTQQLAGISSEHSRRSPSHFSSLASVASTPNDRPRTPSLTPVHTPVKSASVGNLALSGSPLISDEMNTIPDPRSRAMSPADELGAPSPSQHPDLTDEVATLSNKLINAINHQTHLDDSLSSARLELEAARDRIRTLEAENASHREMMTSDVWIRKSTVETEKRQLHAKILEERHKRLDTEKAKKKIEQELENLTTALFEEANKMVIAAKEEAKVDHEALQRKNDQLKAQLADSESLLKSQQEQLSGLKHVMEHMAAEQEDQTNPTAPSSPGLNKVESGEYLEPTTADPEPSPLAAPVEPSPPTSLSHIIQPVLRNDISAYDDFVSLARTSRNRAGSRVSSSSMNALTALTSFSLGGSTSSAHPSNASTASLTTSAQTNGSAPQSPNTPASTISVNSTASMTPLPPLRETKFYKRVLAEDIEPTLRLDLAPGLSWLARRSVLTSVTDGSLVVEPVLARSSSFLAMMKPQFYPCSLCGESRTDPKYLRNHRFRISEADSAQRHPLCNYCLTRIRSTCGFLGFLRMVKDGHWRTDDEDHEKAAWEESVRLRDQMFWSRLGGGVVPVTQSALSVDLEKSPRPSEESRAMLKPASREASPVDLDRAARTVKKGPIEEPHTPPNQMDGAASIRSSINSLEVKSISGSEGVKRLSLSIPSKDC